MPIGRWRGSAAAHRRARRQPTRRFEQLEHRQLLATDVVISEFLADNVSSLADVDGQRNDWVELYNTTNAAVSVNGWRLTDDSADLSKWVFPNVSVPAKGYLTVFASDKNRAVAGQELHTNFKLSAGGEYLALVKADNSIATQFTPNYPALGPDISYGGTFTILPTQTLVAANAAAKAWIPTSAASDATWRDVGFNDAAWLAGTQGVGYEAGSGYGGLFNIDVIAMRGVNQTTYIRIPFNVADPSAFDSFTLRAKYDDGFIAYFNGVKLTERNPPAGAPQWDSAAGALHDDGQAVVFEDIPVTVPSGTLQASNVLAIHGLNFGINSSDYLIVSEFLGAGSTYDPNTLAFFSVPSPGAPNNGAAQGVVLDTQFSHARGFYSAPFQLTISTLTPGAEIRYTTDGSEPTASTGTVYTAPFTISAMTTLRVAAFKAGFVPTNVDTQTYIFTADVVLQSPSEQPPGAGWPTTPAPPSNQDMDYGMDPDIVNSPTWGPQLDGALKALPSFSVVTALPNLFNSGTGIWVNPSGDEITWERPASAELIYPDGTDGFQINAGLRIRGGYSRSPDNPKHALRLFFRAEYGDGKLNFPLFGPDAAQSFDKLDLRTGQNYSWSFGNDGNMSLTRDIMSRDAQLAMGEPSTHGFAAHLYINGQYWGVYQTQERSEASFGETYFGGDRNDYDAVKVDPDLGYIIEATDGNLTAWNDFVTQSQNLAALGTQTLRYNKLMELQGKNPDGTDNPAYPVYLDADNLIDYMLVIFYGGNLDAPISNFLGNTSPNNWYGVRNRIGREGWRFFAHDSEHTLLNVNEDRTGPFASGSAATGGLPKSNPQWVHQQLMASDEYRLRFIDRVQKHFFNDGAMTTQNIQERHDARTGELATAIIAESARWGDSKKGAAEAPYTKSTWESAVNNINVNFIPGRNAVLLNQLLIDQRDSGGGVLVSAPLWVNPATAEAPVLNQFGGRIAPGFQVTMSKSSGGTIYYTTDGSDPRAVGGAVGATATAYSSAVTLADTTVVKARTLNAGVWSGLIDVTFGVDLSALRVTEIMYNPAPPTVGSPYTNSDYEFIELQNTGATTLDLQTARFAAGINFTFPAMNLAAGGRVVLVKNPAAFAERYPGVTITGTYTGLLDDNGERLLLQDAVGVPILDFSYSDGWYNVTDGDGFSLVIVNSSAAASTWGQQASWRPSQFYGGNPLAGDGGINPGSIVINELLANTAGGVGDWIELYNTTAAPINVGNWYLSDSNLDLKKFKIPAGTTIAAGGLLVFEETAHFGNAGYAGTTTPFEFSELGGKAFLSSSDGSGNLAGYREDKDFGASDAEVAFARYVKSTGASDFVPVSTNSSGAANAYPKVGPIVINEVMYNPPVGGDEFIELLNVTGAAVPLYDPANPSNTWKFTAGVTFAFPVGVTIPAGGYALVVGIAPNTFRSKYGIPGGIPIYGPYTGVLDNGGEKLELSKPGVPQGLTVPYIQVDLVSYDDSPPWAPQPDGGGFSLARLVSANYANDVANWNPSRTGGTPGAVNTYLDISPPAVPTGLVVAAAGATRANLNWDPSSDAETGVSQYRVFRDGVQVGTSASASFTDVGLTPGALYNYTVAAVNGDGFASAASSPAVAYQLLGIASIYDPDTTHVVVVFNETVTAASAQAIANYTLPGETVSAAVLAGDGKTVTLTTTALNQGVVYTLGVANVVAPSGHPLAPGTQATFTAGTGGGLRGEYFNNADLSALALTRTDATVNFDWGVGSPDPAVGVDTFSVRWTGQVKAPTTGTFTFFTVSDDGVRLWVDGQLIVSNWTDHAPIENSGTFAMTAGKKYDIRLEMYENGGGAAATLAWQGPSVAKAIIPATSLFLPPQITIADLSANEGATGTTWFDFVVTLSSGTGATTTVNWSTANGTAAAGSDYTASSGVVTFGPGITSQAISVPVSGDVAVEGNETFNVNLSNAVNATIADSQATGTIVTDDALPSLLIGDVAVTEGNAGTIVAGFNVTLSAASGGTVTVVYATASGSANAPGDYAAASGTLTFNPGVVSQPINVTVGGDLLDEPNETFFVNLSAATNANIGDSQAQGTITDDDPAPSISINDASIAEGNAGASNASFTVSLSAASSFQITVVYSTADLSATAGSDYVAQSGTLTFAPGATTLPIDVVVNGDVDVEANESFQVNLSSPANATISDALGVGTILEDDSPPNISIDDVTLTEADAGLKNFVFAVTLSGPAAVDVTVVYATANGTAQTANPADYFARSATTLTFSAGVTSQNIIVISQGDTRDEDDETFFVNLSSPVNATLADAQGVGTIVDNDLPPGMSVDDVSISEGNAGTVNLDFTLTLTVASGKTITVQYATANGTANAPADYTAASGTLTLNPGATTATVSVVVNADLVDEVDETFVLDLTNPVNVTLDDSQGTGTILDDDSAVTPSIAIGDLTVTEGDAGTANATFNVTLSAASGQQVTVVYNTADGSAAAPADYTSASGTLTFAAGVTSQPIVVPIVGDLLDELNETFTVTLSSPVNAALADGSATGTINDNDAAPSLTIGDIAVTEGDAGTANATFNVTLSAASGQQVTVVYNTADASAAAPADYTSASGTLTFAAGVTSQPIVVPIVGDLLDELNETFTVTLSSPVNATLADGSATGTINDNDAAPGLTIGDVAVTEGDAGTANATFSVTLSAASGQQVTVVYNTADGSATAPADYTATSGTLTFAAGSTSQPINVPIVGDLLDELNETFTVTLTSPVNATLADGSATGTINDNEGVPGLTIGDVTVTEGDAGTANAAFSVTLSAASGQQVTVVYNTADASAAAPADYTATSGTLTFAAGATSQPINVPIVGDLLDEANETFTVTLASPVNATLADGSATGTINDNDAAPSLTIGDVTVTEGDAGTANATFNVTLSAASGQQVTVVYNTADGSAAAPADYTSASGTLTFAAGVTSQPIVVPIVGDLLDELNETFTVTLASPVNATLADGSATGTINDNDAAPSLTIGDIAVTEGDAGTANATFSVTLSAASGQQVTVVYNTADASAAAPADYTSTSGTLTFAAGATSQPINVPIVGDLLDELNETFTVTLSSPVNATLADGSATGTINDNEGVPGLTIGDVTVTEGDAGTANAAFSVTLSAASGQQVTVVYNTADASAAAPADYTATSGTLTFAAGATSQPINVPIVGDLLDEANETFTVTLTSPVNATLADGSATGTINDNDAAPGLTIGDVTVTEGDAGTANATFNVTLSAASGQQVTVVYNTADASAAAPADYTAASGTLTFAAGATSQPIIVPIVGDLLDELNETFTVTLASPVNATLADGSATGTINDNDAAPSLTIGDVTVTEGDAGTANATFSVTLSAASGQQVTVVYNTADASAAAPADYTATSGTLTFAAGATSQPINVPIVGDLLDELNETFTVTLASPVNATLADGSATGTINDNDAAPGLTIGDVTVTEGDAGTANATFSVTLSAASGQQVTVVYNTADASATAPADYTAASGTLTFAAGVTSQPINVPIVGDLLDELNETFTVTLTSPVNATLADGSATGTINDNDAAPGLTIGDVPVTEGDAGTANATFSVTLSAASGQQVTVVYNTADASAAAPADYTATSGTLTFAAGATSQPINVPIVGDLLDELNETFTVTLASPVNATLADGSATGTINDNEGVPGLTIGDVTVTEGDAGTANAAFSVTLSAASGQQVTVVYNTADASAAAPADYTATSGTLTFAAGATSQPINVPIVGDLLDEANETFTVTLASPVNATLADGSATGTINDNDAAPSLTIGDVTVTEGDAGTANATFNVTLSAASGQQVTVVYNTADGSATAPADYTVTSGTLTFAAGATSQPINVPIVGDTTVEATESFTVNLSAPTNATLADGAATGTINDNDSLQTSFVVINTNDAGAGSLRQAVLDANANAGIGHTIAFAIPGAGPHAIQLAAPLPALVDPASADVPAGSEIQVGTFSTHSFAPFASLTKIGGGVLVIAGAQSHAAGATLTIAAGEVHLDSDAGGNLNVAVQSAARFGATQHLASLSLAAGATATLDANGARVLVTPALSIAAGGKLNLADNDLVVRATPGTRAAVLAQVTSLVASGSAGLSWNGPGINSSAAAGDPTSLTALGVMLNDDGAGGPFHASFDGQAVTANDVLVKYTYYGDADLSGSVDGTDYALIDNGFNAALVGWFNGDFDHGGTVDGTDYALIDNAFNSQSGPLSAFGPVPRAADGAALERALAGWTADAADFTWLDDVAAGRKRRGR